MNQKASLRNFSLRNLSTLWAIIISAVVAGLLAGGGVYYWQRSLAENKKEQALKKARNEVAQEFTLMRNEINVLRTKLDYVLKETLQRTVQDPLSFYLDKLKDRNFTSTYGEGYTWYIAAEELGKMGKLAIPYLIEKLNTKDDYERTQALYALLLASQCGNVTSFTGGEYVRESAQAFPPSEEHPRLVKAWKAWYEKYQSNWQE
ncbi:MAG: hypothetical protein ACE5K3_02105 [bacterium]